MHVDLDGAPREYSRANYDITACCCVFNGHVRPQGLRELVRVTRPSGLITISARKSYMESTSFVDDLRPLQDADVPVPALCPAMAYTSGTRIQTIRFFQESHKPQAPMRSEYEHATGNFTGETDSRCNAT